MRKSVDPWCQHTEVTARKGKVVSQLPRHCIVVKKAKSGNYRKPEFAKYSYDYKESSVQMSIAIIANVKKTNIEIVKCCFFVSKHLSVSRTNYQDFIDAAYCQTTTLTISLLRKTSS